MKISDRLRRSGPLDGRAAVAGRARLSGPEISDDLLTMLQAEVVDRLDTAGNAELDPTELSERVAELVEQVVHERQMALSPGERQRAVTTIIDEIVGLGPLEELMADPTVSDILVNTAERVYVERAGVLERTSVHFKDDNHLLNTINRIVAKVGRRIDESSPMVDARLPDGSRVNAVIRPVAVDGPLLSIRRFRTGPVSMRDLARQRSLSPGIAVYLQCAVRAKCNILISGGTGSGKTTLLNALSRYISSHERIITIEDAAELQLQQEHIARLETRECNIEGKGEVAIRDLVRNALRMRPDRIIVGEVRSVEVLDMIQAMNTGHEGSMTTIHANAVDDAFTRLIAMLSMAGTGLSEGIMLQMIARAIHIVVHVGRDLEGKRRVIEVSETAGVEQGEVRLNTVFRWDRAARRQLPGEEGDELGVWRCTGYPTLLDRFAASSVPLDPRYLAEVQ